jgi:hypothetical protein
LFQEEGELQLNLQVIAKKKKNSTFYAGFTIVDELIL